MRLRYCVTVVALCLLVPGMAAAQVQSGNIAGTVARIRLGRVGLWNAVIGVRVPMLSMSATAMAAMPVDASGNPFDCSHVYASGNAAAAVRWLSDQGVRIVSVYVDGNKRRAVLAPPPPTTAPSASA